jgi:hypothetical protein
MCADAYDLPEVRPAAAKDGKRTTALTVHAKGLSCSTNRVQLHLMCDYCSYQRNCKRIYNGLNGFTGRAPEDAMPSPRTFSKKTDILKNAFDCFSLFFRSVRNVGN